MKKILGYFRVSTKKQGDSNLGIEAQQFAVQQYAGRENAEIIATYTEIESGKKSDRPALLKALAHAKRAKALLVVAKLDRLSRNVAFLSTLMESGVDFLAVDQPHANKLTIHLLAAVAEAEALAISERTKAALAAASRRGVLLGSARPSHPWRQPEQRLAAAAKGRPRAVAAIKRNASRAYEDLLPLILEMRGNNASLPAIAAHLNSLGHTTRNGSEFSHVQVWRIIKRTEVVR